MGLRLGVAHTRVPLASAEVHNGLRISAPTWLRVACMRLRIIGWDNQGQLQVRSDRVCASGV